MGKHLFFISIGGQRVEVSQEVYLTYYRSKRRDRYFERDIKTETAVRDKDGNVISYRPAKEDSLDRRMEAGEQFAAVQTSVEDTVLCDLMAEELHEALDKLPESERELMDALYFQGLTEREYTATSGIPQKTINDRKNKILTKLKKVLVSGK